MKMHIAILALFSTLTGLATPNAPLSERIYDIHFEESPAIETSPIPRYGQDAFTQPETDQNSWGCPQMSLRASSTWDIAVISAKMHGGVLVTALFRGKPFSNEAPVGTTAAWSLLIRGRHDENTEPRLIHWPQGLTPITASPTQDGFEILFSDQGSGRTVQLNLDLEGEIEEWPIILEDPEPVVQPEDMPEGTGG